MSRKYGLSWSWKRATGLSSARRSFSRRVGVPLSRSGRQRALGRALGCCVPLAVLLGVVGALAGVLAHV